MFVISIAELLLLTIPAWIYFHYFFFQAEDGIRDLTVTGVQTCALPISVVDGPALRRDFNHAPLLPLRAGHVFAVAEKLQATQAPEHRYHPYHGHGADNQQTFCLYLAAVALRVQRSMPALRIGRPAACWSDVRTLS